MLMLTPEPASCRGASRHLGLLSCPTAQATESIAQVLARQI